MYVCIPPFSKEHLNIETSPTNWLRFKHILRAMKFPKWSDAAFRLIAGMERGKSEKSARVGRRTFMRKNLNRGDNFLHFNTN